VQIVINLETNMPHHLKPEQGLKLPTARNETSDQASTITKLSGYTEAGVWALNLECGFWDEGYGLDETVDRQHESVEGGEA
jgi:hypothetical protein